MEASGNIDWRRPECCDLLSVVLNLLDRPPESLIKVAKDVWAAVIGGASRVEVEAVLGVPIRSAAEFDTLRSTVLRMSDMFRRRQISVQQWTHPSQATAFGKEIHFDTEGSSVVALKASEQLRTAEKQQPIAFDGSRIFARPQNVTDCMNGGRDERPESSLSDGRLRTKQEFSAQNNQRSASIWPDSAAYIDMDPSDIGAVCRAFVQHEASAGRNLTVHMPSWAANVPVLVDLQTICRRIHAMQSNIGRAEQK